MSEPITVWLEMPVATVGDWDRVEKMRAWIKDRCSEGHTIDLQLLERRVYGTPFYVLIIVADFADKGLAALFKLTWG